MSCNVYNNNGFIVDTDLSKSTGHFEGLSAPKAISGKSKSTDIASFTLKVKLFPKI